MIDHIIAYMTALGHRIDRNPGEVNIVWIEGVNPDGQLNTDAADGWNDLCVLFTFDGLGNPRILHNAVGTTEPGGAATHSSQAKRLGGVARIAFGQYTAWQVGVHKKANHPALVQRAGLRVHRDRNRDGVRTKDPVTNATGINMHGTDRAYKGRKVGLYSQGCLVHCNWPDHLQFMRILQTDPRYVANATFMFTASILNGGEMIAYAQSR